MKAAIIGGGIVENYATFADEIKKCDFIICADGGIKHLINVNIPPHVFIGDFDSCEFDYVENLQLLKDTRIYRHDPIKDDTDMQLCIDHALDEGYDELVLFAALGGRIDHEISNIYHLKYILEKGAYGMIFSENNQIFVIDHFMKIRNKDGFKLSLIPLTPITKGVTLKGLYYPLDNADLIQGSSLGISNEFVDEYAEIHVNEGLLMIILAKDSLNLN